ncbi:MAG: hypothetical protein RH860_09720 [Cytophagales bacterium]
MKNIKQILFIVLLISFISCDSGNTESVSPAAANGSELPQGQGGSLARFAILSDHLYALNWNTLNTFDIRNANDPQYISNVQIGTGIETIFIRQADSTMFIGSQNGMHIYNAQDLRNPQFLSVYEHVWACDPVVANDKYAFVTLNSDQNFGCFRGVNQLEIVNIENLRNPFSEEVYPMTQPKGLGLHDTLLFVCDEGLKVFDFNTPQDLSEIANHNISAFDVIPAIGNYEILFVIGEEGLYQYQYRNATLELLSVIPLGS